VEARTPPSSGRRIILASDERAGPLLGGAAQSDSSRSGPRSVEPLEPVLLTRRAGARFRFRARAIGLGPHRWRSPGHALLRRFRPSVPLPARRSAASRFEVL